MELFFTVKGSRKKTAHILCTNMWGVKMSLCNTTGIDYPGQKEAHETTCYSEMPDGYEICKPCLLKAMGSGFIEIKYLMERPLVEETFGVFVQRPLTIEEYAKTVGEDDNE